jgi:hypothetical protein
METLFQIVRIGLYIMFGFAIYETMEAIKNIGGYYKERKVRLSNKKVCDMCYKKIVDTMQEYD